MDQIFQILGMMVLLYAVAEVLHYANLRLADGNLMVPLQYLLSIVCIILWLLSLPITLVLGSIKILNNRRVWDVVRSEVNRNPNSQNPYSLKLISTETLCVILVILVAVLGFHVSSLSDTPSEEALIEEYENGFEKGYEEGCIDSEADAYKDGYDDGYMDGIDKSWEDSYLDGYNDGYADGSADGSSSSS